MKIPSSHDCLTTFYDDVKDRRILSQEKCPKMKPHILTVIFCVLKIHGQNLIRFPCSMTHEQAQSII